MANAVASLSFRRAATTAMDASESDQEILGVINKTLCGSDAENEEEIVCEVCGQDIPEGMLSKHGRFGFKCIDVESFNALHSLERVAGKDEKMKTKLKAAAKSDPDKIKAMAIGLRTTKKRTRRARARAEASEYMNTILQQKVVKRVGKCFLLGTFQCIMRWIHNFGYSREAAKEKWEADKKDKNFYKEMEGASW